MKRIALDHRAFFGNSDVIDMAQAKKKKGEKENEGGTKPWVLGIIPARGGSKGVPRKNIKPLAGKPLLYYMLKAALESKHITHVVVSSEDDEILQIAEKIGGKDVVLRRPKKYALDKSPDVPMLQHAVKAMEKTIGQPFDYVVQLHATNPFTHTDDIDGLLSLLFAEGADSSVSVHQANSLHPQKMKKIIDNRLHQYTTEFDEKTTSRRQDFEPVYRRNAGIYASRRHIVMDQERVWGDDCVPYIMPHERSFEVDTPLDFLIADLLMRRLKKYGKLEP